MRAGCSRHTGTQWKPATCATSTISSSARRARWKLPPELQAQYRDRYRWISVDEYQDVDEQQVRLLKQLVPPDGNICAIGDPDQSVYGFRGADVRFFSAFRRDFPGTRVVGLTRNYRSNRNIVELSTQVIGPSGSARALGPGRGRRAGISSPSTRRLPRRPRRSSSCRRWSRCSAGTASSPSTAGGRRTRGTTPSRFRTSPCCTAPRDRFRRSPRGAPAFGNSVSSTARIATCWPTPE